MEISRGGISGTVTDVRLIFQAASKGKASGIIVAHNHPSGNLNPSENDTRITQKIKEAGNLMDIQLLDPLILTMDGSYYSFADNGLLSCKHCRGYFRLSEDTQYLIEEGYINPDSCNICDDCWDMLQPSEYDYSETFSDADPGL